MWCDSPRSILLLSVISVSTVVADDIGVGIFIFPTSPGPQRTYVANYVWPIGSVQTLQWATTMEKYDVLLYQQALADFSANLTATLYTAKNGGSGRESFNWAVQTYKTNLNKSNVYYLRILGNQSEFTSHYFNLSLATSSVASSQPVTIISSTSLAGATTSTSPTNSPTPGNADVTLDQDTLKIGLGVGLGVGIPFVLIVGIWVGLTVVKYRKSTATIITSEDTEEPSDQKQLPVQYVYKAMDSRPSIYYEVTATPKSPAELHGDPVHSEMLY